MLVFFFRIRNMFQWKIFDFESYAFLKRTHCIKNEGGDGKTPLKFNKIYKHVEKSQNRKKYIIRFSSVSVTGFLTCYTASGVVGLEKWKSHCPSPIYRKDLPVFRYVLQKKLIQMKDASDGLLRFFSILSFSILLFPNKIKKMFLKLLYTNWVSKSLFHANRVPTAFTYYTSSVLM